MMLLLLVQDQQEFRQVYIHGRANLKTLILFQEESALEKTKYIENYYGFENGIAGKELYEKGKRQAENIGVLIEKQEVISIQKEEEKFIVRTQQDQYSTRSIILATGNKKNKPNIKNIEKFEGRGISYCAVCDGFFYRNKKVVVIGNGNYAISELNELMHLVDSIILLTNGKKAPEFRAENVKIEEKEIEAIEGEKQVEEIQFKDGSRLKTEGVFVANGVAGSLEFAKKLGILTRK